MFLFKLIKNKIFPSLFLLFAFSLKAGAEAEPQSAPPWQNIQKKVVDFLVKAGVATVDQESSKFISEVLNREDIIKFVQKLNPEEKEIIESLKSIIVLQVDFSNKLDMPVDVELQNQIQTIKSFASMSPFSSVFHLNLITASKSWHKGFLQKLESDLGTELYTRIKKAVLIHELAHLIKKSTLLEVTRLICNTLFASLDNSSVSLQILSDLAHSITLQSQQVELFCDFFSYYVCQDFEAQRKFFQIYVDLEKEALKKDDNIYANRNLASLLTKLKGKYFKARALLKFGSEDMQHPSHKSRIKKIFEFKKKCDSLINLKDKAQALDKLFSSQLEVIDELNLAINYQFSSFIRAKDPLLYIQWTDFSKKEFPLILNKMISPRYSKFLDEQAVNSKEVMDDKIFDQQNNFDFINFLQDKKVAQLDPLDKHFYLNIHQELNDLSIFSLDSLKDSSWQIVFYSAQKLKKSFLKNEIPFFARFFANKLIGSCSSIALNPNCIFINSNLFSFVAKDEDDFFHSLEKSLVAKEFFKLSQDLSTSSLSLSTLLQTISVHKSSLIFYMIPVVKRLEKYHEQIDLASDIFAKLALRSTRDLSWLIKEIQERELIDQQVLRHFFSQAGKDKPFIMWRNKINFRPLFSLALSERFDNKNILLSKRIKNLKKESYVDSKSLKEKIATLTQSAANYKKAARLKFKAAVSYAFPSQGSVQKRAPAAKEKEEPAQTSIFGKIKNFFAKKWAA